MPIEPLRTAVLGLGRMGRFHLAAIPASSTLEVVALAEPAPTSMDAATLLRPAAALYTGVDDALAHPGLEACLIASPTTTHPSVVRVALERGLHVLCEKPLALDPDEARLLGAQAAARGLVLQVGFWRRYSPPWAEARACIERGDIGTPLMVRLSQWDADPPAPSFCDPSVSGGLAIDCGVHEFDLATWLTGRAVTAVSAWSLPIVDDGVRGAGDVDNLVAVLELDGGGVATVDLSRNARYGDDVRTEVLGSDGALFVDAWPSGRLRVATADGERVVDGTSVADVMAAGVVRQAEAFVSAVRGNEPNECAAPGADASATATAIGIATTAAARSGRAIRLPSTPSSVSPPASGPTGPGLGPAAPLG